MTTAPSTPSQAPRQQGMRFSPSSLMGLGFVAIFAYFDWMMHRSVATAIILGLIAGGLILFWSSIIDALNLRETANAIPQRVKPVLAAIPGVAYFLIRGQGTSGSGGIVLVSMLVIIAISVVFGPAMDRALTGYYRARNRVLPRPLRMALAIVLPILVAFLVIHGSLSDLPALWGGDTKHPANPIGKDGRFFFGSILSACIAWLLLRDAQAATAPATAGPAAAGGMAAPAGYAMTAAPAPVQQPMPMQQPQMSAPAPAPVQPTPPPLAQPTWVPSHRIPDGGLSAWAEPNVASASMRLDSGLGVQVVGSYGDWVQVRAENGWTGWVDGRYLRPEQGQR